MTSRIPVVDSAGQVQHLDSLMNDAITKRADLRAINALIDETTLRTQLVRREVIPNVRVGLYVEQMPNERGLRLGPALGFGIPLWNRNQGTVDALTARRRQLEFDRRAVLLQVRAEIVTAASAYAATANEVAIYARTVLQPARTNGALLETAYRAGKIPCPPCCCSAISCSMQNWATGMPGCFANAHSSNSNRRSADRPSRHPTYNRPRTLLQSRHDDMHQLVAMARTCASRGRTAGRHDLLLRVHRMRINGHTGGGCR